MHSKLLCTLTLAPFFALQSPAVAQNGRWGIIINEQTKTCAHFWEGNSCSSVKVPKDWQAYLPEWNESKQSLLLTYKDKTCMLGASTAAQCCAQFGFTFDANFKAPVEKTMRSSDPQSECFQLRHEPALPQRP